MDYRYSTDLCQPTSVICTSKQHLP